MATTRKKAPAKAATPAKAAAAEATPGLSLSEAGMAHAAAAFENARMAASELAGAAVSLPATAATGLFVGGTPLRAWARGETLQSDSRPYILYYRGTRYALIGPFGTRGEAVDWAEDKRNNPHDDPRWQVIELSPEHRMPRLAAPWEASLAIQAGSL